MAKKKYTPYSTAQTILGKDYEITLDHMTGFKVDHLLKRLNQGTNKSTTFGSMLYALANIVLGAAGQDVTPELAAKSIYDVVDLETLLEVLRLIIPGGVTDEMFNEWFGSDEPDALDLYKASSWLVEAAIGGGIIKMLDPSKSLLMLKMMRGTITDEERAELMALLDQTLAAQLKKMKKVSS